jgi:hypothetical protein
VPGPFPAFPMTKREKPWERGWIGSKPMIKNISDSCPNFYIENIQIKQVHEYKTLGVTIDQHLSWKSNTENICKKVTAGISAIRRIKPFVANQDTLILIYKHYCSSVI